MSEKNILKVRIGLINEGPYDAPIKEHDAHTVTIDAKGMLTVSGVGSGRILHAGSWNQLTVKRVGT